jgi:hypothetical protein
MNPFGRALDPRSLPDCVHSGGDSRRGYRKKPAVPVFFIFESCISYLFFHRILKVKLLGDALRV